MAAVKMRRPAARKKEGYFKIAGSVARNGEEATGQSRMARPIALGDPNGIRTRVHGLKGRCPNHWTIGSDGGTASMRRESEYGNEPAA